MKGRKNILVILGYTDDQSFCRALADSYIDGAKKSKHVVRFLNLGHIRFDPILYKGYKKIQTLEPGLVRAQKDLLWADHVVWVFPIWWGVYPAIMKGFLDRTFLPGFAYKYTGPSKWNRLLAGRSSRLIVTTGGPALLYKLLGNMPAIYSLKYITLLFCGFKPVKTTLFGSIRKSTPKDQLNKYLNTVKQLGERGI